jgi:MoaA/NifB/PqqE/SkfB family radical SAM enzyme
MLQRIDRLAEIGTASLALSGGEPLLHPDVGLLVRRIRHHGMLASLITNGYRLTADVIDGLNRAGLDSLQLSIDNIEPSEASKKSLRVLDRKLVLLAEGADFDVNVNAVIGPGTATSESPEDALAVGRRARELGFAFTVGLLHDPAGGAYSLDERSRAVFDAIVEMEVPFWGRARYNRFQRALAEGRPLDWHCGAGGRYLYVCEDGLVHWCSQQRGQPGIPLEGYGQDDIDRESQTVKACAPRCTVSCVHQVAMIDLVRENPRAGMIELLARDQQAPALSNMPVGFRILAWLFLPRQGRRTLLARVTRRLLQSQR